MKKIFAISVSVFVTLTVHVARADNLPRQPVDIPVSLSAINPQAIVNDAGNYCQQVAQLSTEFVQAGSAIPKALSDGLGKERQVAAALCAANHKFLGYRNVKDVTAQTMVNVGAVIDGYWKLQGLAQLAGLTGTRSAIINWSEKFEKETLSVFYEGQLQQNYSEAYATSDFQQRKGQLEHWGAELNDYYRNH